MPQGQSINEEPTVAQQLQASLRNLVIATVLLYVVVIALSALGYWSTQQNAQDTRDLAVQTTAALCALRFDLEARVEQGQEFLDANPEGIKGIPAETLQQTIEGQQRTISSLSVLDCPATGGG